ncbi:MAG: hypothetical protein ACE147_05555 [Candidatus Methylomirabilales bacterium]
MRDVMKVLGVMVVLVLVGVGPAHPAGSSMASAPALPLSKVVLYTSGVGYFQRDGVVEGRAEVELRFRADQVNDLLKSLVVQDFDGGQVGVMTYDSRDPITKTLQTFAIDLTASVGLGQLLERVRGEEVEVSAPTPLRGVILGVEKKRERAGDKDAVEVEYLNLLTESGLRAVPLPGVQRIQLGNPRLDAELRQALQVLASARDTQKKTVRLTFEGQGRRRVRVGYVMEAPVWKTSYRLALTDGKPPFLQGWAMMENTTDDDWEAVSLSLISGRPISFTMDLYEPLYVKRPALTLERYESLRPQAYEQAREADTAKSARLEALAEAPSVGRAARMALPAPAPLRRDVSLEGGGVAAAAEGREAGELFEYAVATPVSLARHKSAMLPIVNTGVAGEKVSIYNERVHAKHPLNGVRLKNTTGQHLLQGPITVFDGGVYAGDAQLGDVTAGQERLLSYALDLRMEIEPQRAAEQEALVSASLRKGALLVTRKQVSEKTYIVTNRDQKPKTALIEHPARPEWKLVEPKAPERTRDAYRFAVTAKPRESARLQVREERPIQQTIAMADAGPNVIALYLQAREVSPRVKEALGRVAAFRSRLDRTAAKRGDTEKRIEEITKEQGRIRENMGRVPANSELHARYLAKLGQQETEIESLRKELAALRSEERSQKHELEEYLLKLDVE